MKGYYLAQSPPDWQEILQNFRGSELQNYFTRILEDDLVATVKPQYVDNIPKAIRSVVWPLPFFHSSAVRLSLQPCCTARHIIHLINPHAVF